MVNYLCCNFYRNRRLSGKMDAEKYRGWMTSRREQALIVQIWQSIAKHSPKCSITNGRIIKKRKILSQYLIPIVLICSTLYIQVHRRKKFLHLNYQQNDVSKTPNDVNIRKLRFPLPSLNFRTTAVISFRKTSGLNYRDHLQRRY